MQEIPCKAVLVRNDNVLVKLEPDQTHGIDPGKGGLIEAPEAYTYHACRGRVIALGPGVQRWSPRLRRHVWRRPDVRVGERVFVPPKFGLQLQIGGDEYRLGREPDLELVIEEG
jgi:co-chaperonin GroES (HSP10)